MAKITPDKIVEQLNDNDESLDLLLIERSIGICSSVLMDLREFVNQYNFKDEDEEIIFFKVIKPYELREYLFHSKLFEIEAKQPVISKMARKNIKENDF